MSVAIRTEVTVPNQPESVLRSDSVAEYGNRPANIRGMTNSAFKVPLKMHRRAARLCRRGQHTEALEQEGRLGFRDSGSRFQTKAAAMTGFGSVQRFLTEV